MWFRALRESIGSWFVVTKPRCFNIHTAVQAGWIQSDMFEKSYLMKWVQWIHHPLPRSQTAWGRFAHTRPKQWKCSWIILWFNPLNAPALSLCLTLREREKDIQAMKLKRWNYSPIKSKRQVWIIKKVLLWSKSQWNMRQLQKKKKKTFNKVVLNILYKNKTLTPQTKLH